MISDSAARLDQQLTFLAELDKLKDVLRRNRVAGSGRLEKSAEHSWHLALMSMTLLEHGHETNLDQGRILRLLLVHDIVEIDAGDTFCYDAAENLSKAARESAAADRIFNLLPGDQASDLRALWAEFEGGTTPESRMAQALDRLQPILQNLRTGGASWRQHGVTKTQVFERNHCIAEEMPEVWEKIRRQIEAAEQHGAFRLECQSSPDNKKSDTHIVNRNCISRPNS